MSSPPFHPGLAALTDRYDAFIVDLWGVMHDGVSAFPAAVAALEALRAAGKRSIILSNAPRRADVITARNVELGIPADLPDALMSSGEDTWQHLKTRPDAWYRALGRRCYHLGPERDFGMREGLDLDFIDDLGEADFILNTGNLSSDDSVEVYRDFLDRALQLKLPMICANPDLLVLRGESREICAGALALDYEQKGGAVRWHGKPHPEVYRSCFALLPGVPAARIAAIGDSLRTDVAGAAAAGIDSIFIAGGIHGEELGVDSEGKIDPGSYSAFVRAAEPKPTAVLPFMRW
ncbi:TIGR01459 family HAD-type hydrolase [Pelagibius litoralis]|uniref:TIGR01459 family HAD-type hydrolase n=1 Tax=Pelagibius litoralis TaxID=374515 RepID=A0A967F407_9PROT|nr:TIGR01459 family HAD-type hydrolase [Pelagibius litoralis]NIA72460.1 TIGR01459 family HAD-type hydrolase [Pelagibius litoralis]